LADVSQGINWAIALIGNNTSTTKNTYFIVVRF
jgi:hypothetical protein